jgi:hypothetical protein
LAPPTGLQPLSRWIRGPLSVPYKPGTRTYKLQVKIGSEVCTHAPPHVLQYQTLPPSQGGLCSCHVSSGSGSHLPDRKGSGAMTCIVVPYLLGGLRSCHVSNSSGSHLSDKKGSGAIMCVVTPDLLGGLWCATFPVALDPPSL